MFISTASSIDGDVFCVVVKDTGCRSLQHLIAIAWDVFGVACVPEWQTLCLIFYFAVLLASHMLLTDSSAQYLSAILANTSLRGLVFSSQQGRKE